MFQISKPKKTPGKQDYSIGVLLCSGQIYILNSETPSDPGSWAIDRDFTGLKIPGKVIGYTGDPSMYKLNLFLAEVPLAVKSADKVDPNGPNKDIEQSEQPSKLKKEKSAVESHKDNVPAEKEKKKEIRAYAFTTALHDITD